MRTGDMSQLTEHREQDAPRLNTRRKMKDQHLGVAHQTPVENDEECQTADGHTQPPACAEQERSLCAPAHVEEQRRQGNGQN